MRKLNDSNKQVNLTTNTEFERDYDYLKDLYWGGRGKKQGRNDKCRCGSGKKFKRCCYSKGLQSGKESVLKHLTGGHLGKELNPNGYTPYVVNWKGLNNQEFNERYMDFLKVYPVTKSGCFFNSFKLMYEMRDLGVEQVHGWYGFDVETCVEYPEWEKRYLDGKRGMEYVYDNSDSGKNHWPGYDCVWDYEKGRVWKRHAWNKLNGVHFDVTRDTFESDWTYYNEEYSQDWSDLLFSESEDKNVPQLFQSLQRLVQRNNLYLDDSLTLKGRESKRKLVKDYQFS